MPLITGRIEPDAQQVSITWLLNAPQDAVWAGLTNPRALPHWLGTVTSGQFVPGDVVIVEHAEDYFCSSRILDCEPGRLLSMTWKFADEPLSQLQIVLTPGGASGTQLALTHCGLGDEMSAYLPGWQTHLLYLEAFLLGQPLPMADFWSEHERQLSLCGQGTVATPPLDR